MPVVATNVSDVKQFTQVDVVGAGSISMATIDQLRGALGTLRHQIQQQQDELREAGDKTEDALADLGALLVPRRGWWNPPTEFHPQLLEAERLVAQIALLDERIARAEPNRPPGAAATLLGVPARVARRDPVHERSRAAGKLRNVLVQIASAAGATAPAVGGVPDAEPLLTKAFELQSRASELRAASSAAEAQAAALDRELRARDEAARQMGFDALHLAAYFRAHGMPAVESPVELQRGEVAHFCTGVALSRSTIGVRLPGFTPPAAHTGVRFWLGTFRSGSMPALPALDTGTLTISNRMLHFAGGSQAFATPLDNLVEIDVYADALAVLALGRESAEFYRVAAPRQVAFYLNWAQDTSSKLG